MSVGQALVTAEKFKEIVAERDAPLELIRGEPLDSQRLPTTLHDGDTLTSERSAGFECGLRDLFEGC